MGVPIAPLSDRGSGMVRWVIAMYSRACPILSFSPQSYPVSTVYVRLRLDV